MQMTARDVMTTRLHTLKSDQTVADAVRIFRKASEEEGRKVFGMTVTDESNRLIGMLSMYDILLFIRPKHIHVWGTMDDIDISGLVENACDRTRTILVGDIMSTDLISVTPDTHLMILLDLMINKHVRRIPVLENDNILGIVYISDLFYNLLDKLSA
ncbi:MAG: signal transduction protein [Deltaproteobacteria bacterium]|nr:MAG: signal transduction protein [Deltaproteobacteria bacterium]RTZ97880.1 MAG: signal transduction protein [Deltaproteobacteria bacterium]